MPGMRGVYFVILFVHMEGMFIEERDKLQLCNSEDELLLSAVGELSSRSVHLDPGDGTSPCILRIRAPETYLVHLQFEESSLDIHNTLTGPTEHPPCYLNIYLPDNRLRPVWSGDLCSREPLPPVDLLTPQIKLSWQPAAQNYYTKERHIILTAIGQGSACGKSDQHTCIKIGWEPQFCISDHLLCNGHENCPKGSNTGDEDENVCKNRVLRREWEQLAVDILKRLKPSAGLINNKWIFDASRTSTQAPVVPQSSWNKLSRIVETTTPNSMISEAEGDAFTVLLSQYGPWGYLMLGLVVCASLLIICVLWECCVRRPKQETTLESLPDSVYVVEDPSPRPPDYEDLDQPPSYSALFPANKVVVVNANGTVELSDRDAGEDIPMGSINSERRETD